MTGAGVVTSDILDELAAVAPGSPLDGLRQHRAATRTNAQASYDALFESTATGVTPAERFAVASFVAALHRAEAAHVHYRGRLVEVAGEELANAVDEVAAAAATEGPYGSFPATAELRDEDAPGLVLTLDADAANRLGARLTAGFEHSHLLVFRPREASPAALQALLDAGWSTPEIVTLSQLVAFLSFQLRVAHGLAVLQESLS